jgi:short-subunit dehydrogenase
METRTVLITGAGRGLGKQVARVLRQSGRYELLLSTHRTKIAQRPRQTVVEGDLLDNLVLQSLIGEANRRKVCVLVNCAGVYSGEPFETLTSKGIRELLALNLTVPIYLIRGIWHTLKETKGMIINAGSLAGKLPSKNETIYCASKHGLCGFLGSLQFDAVAAGVKIVDLVIGAMKTDMSAGRPNWDLFINPADVADVIFSYISAIDSKHTRSLRVTEMNLMRSRY